MPKILKVIGYIWLTIVLLPIIGGLISVGVAGFGVPEVIVAVMVILPAAGLLVLARWLENRKTD